MPCNGQCLIVLQQVVSCMRRHISLYHINILLWHAVMCYVMLCYAMLYFVMSRCKDITVFCSIQHSAILNGVQLLEYFGVI